MAKDTRSDAAQTALVAQELVDQGVKIMITPCDADPSIAAGQVTQAAQIPAFSFCATTPTMPLAVGDYMFGNYPADNVQAAVLAAYAVEKGYKKAYILKSPDSAYTLKLPEYFGEAFKAKGGELLGEGTFSMGQQDFGAEVTKIKAIEIRHPTSS
ncbi:ABC transporter substrate-binding protein [Ensifer canadensis]